MIFQETEGIELKRVYNDTLPKEIVAFLNTSGGTVYIGVDDDGTVLGVENLDDVQKKIADVVTMQILPNPQEYVEIGSKYISGKNIVEIKVRQGNGLYYIKKYGRSATGCFIRVGTSCRSMTEEQIEKGLMRFMKRADLRLVDLPCLNQNLTFNTLKAYLNNNGIHVNEKTFAVNYHLLNHEKKYNEMAFLLADENDISIKVAVFKGKDKTEFLKRNEYGGKCLLASIERVVDYFDAINDTYVEVGSHKRKEKKMFDLNAFKEAWINACVHNSWTKKTPPAVYVFEDRVEIVSTGSIPSSMTKEQFMAGESRPVNDELMRIFLACGIVEQSGHGVPLVVKEYGEKAYKFEGDFIKVVIPLDKKGFTTSKNEVVNEVVNEGVSLTDKEITIYRIVKRNPDITYLRLAEEIGVSKATAERIMKSLKEKGIITRVGSDKTGHWETK